MQTTFLGITITRQQVEDALREFARQYPDPESYENWLQNNNYKFAISYKGRLYPPKYILSMITGIPTPKFSGGKPTNRVFRDLGFEVVDK
jgi:hypothetical protein